MKINFYSSTDEVLRELGSRLRAMRIAMPLTQKEMAERTNLSVRTISNLETGNDTTLSTVVEVLRVLGQLQALELVVPEQSVRPSEIVALGKARERATSKKSKPQPTNHWKWGDEK